MGKAVIAAVAAMTAIAIGYAFIRIVSAMFATGAAVFGG